LTLDWNLDRVRHGADRRATVRLMYYWLSLRRIGDLPAFADFDPRRNPVRWEICFLMRAVQEAPPVFEHIGSDIEPQTPGGPSPAHTLLTTALEGMETVRRTTLPYRRDGSLAHPGRQAVRYRSILLPFADLDGQLRYVLGAVSHCLDAADPVRLVAVERAGTVPPASAAGQAGRQRALAV
jgi:hypothetical protein